MKTMTPEEAGFIYQQLHEIDLEKRRRKAVAKKNKGEDLDARQLSILDYIDEKTKGKK